VAPAPLICCFWASAFAPRETAARLAAAKNTCQRRVVIVIIM
jgi:hypothetical protein